MAVGSISPSIHRRKWPNRGDLSHMHLGRRRRMALPLGGVRVLDLSQFLAGPYGTQILGDLGAGVIKIEPPAVGDGCRGFPPHFRQGFSGYFLAVNRNKKSMTLDLKQA